MSKPSPTSADARREHGVLGNLPLQVLGWAVVLVLALASVGLAIAQVALGDELASFARQNALSSEARSRLLVMTAWCGGAGLVLAAAIAVLRRPNMLVTLGRLSAPLVVAACVPPLLPREAWVDRELHLLLLVAALALVTEALLRVSADAISAIDSISAVVAGLSKRLSGTSSLVFGVCFALLAVAVLAYIFRIGELTVISHRKMQTMTSDLGEFDNLFYNALSGHPMRAPAIEGDLRDWSGLKIHAEFLLYVLLPFYAIAPGAEALLWIQTSVLALTAVPVFLMANRRLGPAAALVFGVSYLLLPVVQRPNFYDYHFTPLGLLCVSFWLFFLDSVQAHGAVVGPPGEIAESLGESAAPPGEIAESPDELAESPGAVTEPSGELAEPPDELAESQGQVREPESETRPSRGLLIGLWVSFVCVLLSREDMALGLGAAALLLAICGYARRWTFPMAAAAVLYFGAMKFGLMAQFGLKGFDALYADLKANGLSGFGAVVATLVTNPTYALRSLITEPKFLYVLHMLVPLAFLWVRRPWFALAAVPALPFTLLVSNRPPHWESSFQYTYHWVGYIVAASIVVVSQMRGTRRPALATLLGVAVLVSWHCGVLLGGEQIRGGFGTKNLVLTEADEERLDRLNEVRSLIPPGASVAATEREGPWVSSRPEMYSLKFTFGSDPDYLFITRPRVRREEEHVRLALDSKEYGLIAQSGEFYLLKRGADTAENRKVRRLLPRPKKTAPKGKPPKRQKQPKVSKPVSTKKPSSHPPHQEAGP